MSTIRTEMSMGRVRIHRRWYKCLFHHNGDGTSRAVVLLGDRRRGRMYTVPTTEIREDVE